MAEFTWGFFLGGLLGLGAGGYLVWKLRALLHRLLDAA